MKGLYPIVRYSNGVPIMNSKKGGECFFIPDEADDIIDGLNDSDVGMLFKSLVRYVFDGEDPKFESEDIRKRWRELIELMKGEQK